MPAGIGVPVARSLSQLSRLNRIAPSAKPQISSPSATTYLAAMRLLRARWGTISFQVFQPYSPANTTATKAQIR